MKIATFLCVLALLALSGRSAHAAVCKKETTFSQLIEAGSKGEQAFADMDLTALLKQAASAREVILPCLKRPLTPKQAAVFHRLMALEAFTLRNDARVIAEFHGARQLAPGYQIPEAMAPEGHALRDYYERAVHSKDGKPEAVFAPEGGYVVAGGVRSAPRMGKTPVILQVYGSGKTPKEAWIETRYIQPGEVLPRWGKNVFGVTARDLGIDTQPTWQKPTPWIISAGVSSMIAAVFYALAINERGKFDDVSTADSDLGGIRDRANGFGWTAVSTGALAVVFTGLGVGVRVAFGGADHAEVNTTTLWHGDLTQPMTTTGGFP